LFPQHKKSVAGPRRAGPFTSVIERSVPMYTRVVELTSKSGKARELSTTINDKVLPILKRQGGFVDETVLVSDTEETRILALSFWNSREDAERYNREQYPTIKEMMRHLLEGDPVIRTFNVESSTTHRITAGKAA
jgi:heme-degrading monooxygenase HmoA